MENGTNSTLTFTQGSGANVAIPAGDTKLIATDGGGSGAIVYDVFATLNVGKLTYTGDLVSSTAGTSNFRAGVNAGDDIQSGGNYNVVIGDEAGTALTTGDNNVAIGFEALATEDAHGNSSRCR